jgi:5-carboxymethyl-2-hydroxymuconate isomerase
MSFEAPAWKEWFGISGPDKIICVGRNYRAHAAEEGADLPAEPLLFGKFSNTLVGPGDPIVLPAASTHVDAEAELVVVIGTAASRVSRADALDHVAGYTVANDVSARDLQFADGQWFRGKGFDSFCPLLPEIAPAGALGDARGLRVTQRLNGELLQDASTSDLIFDIPTLVSYSSHVCSLLPGDVILTGTPDGVGYFREPRIALQPGDLVEIEVEGVGLLANPVT